MGETAFPYPSQQKKSKKTKLAIVVGVIVLVAIIIGVLLISRQPTKTVENKNVVVTTEPTPTEQPKIDKATVKIQVVNGTGTPGQAGIVVKALEDAGYVSDNIKSSNADKFDNTVTTVSERTNFDEIVNDIVTVLKPTFSDIVINTTKLDDGSAFDIVVLTGGKIEATSSSSNSSITPTSTPTPTLSPTPTP